MENLDFLFETNKKNLISFFSVDYLFVFIPLVLIIYTLVPKKMKKYFLLASSFIFFWWISGETIAILIATIIVTYLVGRGIGRIYDKRDLILEEAEKSEKKSIKSEYQKKSRRLVILSIIALVASIFTFKYLQFFTNNLNALFDSIGYSSNLKAPKLLAPIGISFFTLQAISYILDVHRGVIKPEKKIAKLALFTSFFPQIIEGPICRYSQTADQLWNCRPIEKDNFKLGALRVLYGLMKKLIIADRLNAFIDTVFKGYSDYSGMAIFITATLYTIQLYMDFSGSMDAVVGIGQIIGLKIPENFQRPFLSRSISEFWTRWHISLGAWFKDYIFYPVTLSKPLKKLTGRARKTLGNHFGPLLASGIALFCVWILNGLWHGAGWTFISFGMYHFILIYSSSLASPVFKKINEKLKINTESRTFRIWQIIRTSILVVFGELIFRANDMKSAIEMIGKIFTEFTTGNLIADLPRGAGLSLSDFLVVIVGTLIVLCISVLTEKGVTVRVDLLKKPLVIRWGLIYAMLIFIIIFGAYGHGYTPVDPMYANF